MVLSDTAIQACVAVAALAATVLVAFVHYRGLLGLGRHFNRVGATDQGRPLRERTVLKVVAALFVLHVLEIGVFALVYWGLLVLPGTGAIEGTDRLGPFDALYFSAVSFTTVGFGGLKPLGAIRFVAAAEALIGFMLITWSASFMFLHMQRHWSQQDGGDDGEAPGRDGGD